MPSRLLREGILTSDRVDRLDFAAEVFYRRLMSKVDDHGLYDARPSVLRSSLYPLRVDRVREADISRWIAMCEKAGLIALYEADGKTYLEMLDTRWIARSEAKFPTPPSKPMKGKHITSENSCKQVKTVVPVVVVGDVDVVEDVGKAKPARKRATPVRQKTELPNDFAISDRVRSWAADKGYDRLDEYLEAFVGKARAIGYRYVDWDEAFMNSIREDWGRIRERRASNNGPPGKERRSERGLSVMDEVTGRGRRTITGTAERVDSPIVPSLPGQLRKST